MIETKQNWKTGVQNNWERIVKTIIIFSLVINCGIVLTKYFVIPKCITFTHHKQMEKHNKKVKTNTSSQGKNVIEQNSTEYNKPPVSYKTTDTTVTSEISKDLRRNQERALKKIEKEQKKQEKLKQKEEKKLQKELEKQQKAEEKQEKKLLKQQAKLEKKIKKIKQREEHVNSNEMDTNAEIKIENMETNTNNVTSEEVRGN